MLVIMWLMDCARENVFFSACADACRCDGHLGISLYAYLVLIGVLVPLLSL